ncbi:phosphoribosylanthranilate isomerase [Candidatus Vidania fulgoroideorum]
MKLKFCGLMYYNDFINSIKLKINLIGIIFYEKSKRNINIFRIKDILKNIYFFKTKKVGVFVNPNLIFLNKCLYEFKIDYIQYSGNENLKSCIEFQNINKKPWFKCFFLKKNIKNTIIIKKNFSFFMIECYSGGFGGKGKFSNLQLHKTIKKNNYILSGGINELNIKKFKEYYFLDLSSGIEINNRKNFSIMKKIKLNV